MEFFGTEIVRKMLGNDFWVFSLHNEIRSIVQRTNKKIVFLIPDTRFWNEYNKTLLEKDGMTKVHCIHVKSFRNEFPKSKILETANLLTTRDVNEENYESLILEMETIMKETKDHRSEWESILIELKCPNIIIVDNNSTIETYYDTLDKLDLFK